MDKLIKKYEQKLLAQHLCEPGAPILGGIDASTTWNRNAQEITILDEVITGLNINSILYSKPAEPYNSIMNFIIKNQSDNYAIYPQDCETRTFLHDIPVAEKFNARDIIANLKKRKSVIIPDHGIVSYGVVSPEQAFIVYSSVCFSLYVKFFADYYYAKRNQNTSPEYDALIAKTIQPYKDFIHSFNRKPHSTGPFSNSEDIVIAMAEAGRLTVESGMVDSFFGNISYKFGEIIYISQTGSSLDELEGYIDPCPIDNSSTTAITASSEFSAHKSIYNYRADASCILHGHPKFSVIASMICDTARCEIREQNLCHIKCPEQRFIQDIPVVPGEVGTGPTGLVNTLPPALTGRGAIVYGHGLFTTGTHDFREAFASLFAVEKMCLAEYVQKVGIAI